MTTFFSILAVILGVARMLMFIALHLVPSNYNLVEHAVSDYAVGRTRRLSSIMTWTTAAFWAALALATIVAFSSWDSLTSVAIRLIALTVIFVALPFLPTDLEDSKATAVGRLHLVAAVAWFALSYSCMSDFTELLRSYASAPIATTLIASSWVALISLIALVVALLVRPLRRYAFGITERIFLISVNVFYVAVAAGILLLGL
jgi:hypothetical protein